MSAPAIRFVIGGVQKGGTTALAHYLSQHPQLRLPACKEAHVFDAPDFDEAWSVADVDARFEPLFSGGYDRDPSVVHGDATPISMFHPTFVRRMARYNPAMRWIVLLRDPVERAISQYYMERGRGDEHLPLPLALLAERWRLRGHENNFSSGSPLRHHSYLARGRYVAQLDWLAATFPPSHLLLLRSHDLRKSPQDTVKRVLDFLELSPAPAGQTYAPVFTGNWHEARIPALLRPLLSRLYRSELEAIRQRYGISIVDS